MLGDTLVEEGVCALVCVCVIEVQWQAICSEGGGMREGLTRLWLPHEHTNTSTHSHTLTGISDTPDKDVTPLPSCSLFGPLKFLESPNGAAKLLRSETFSFSADFQKILQDCVLAEWDLGLIKERIFFFSSLMLQTCSQSLRTLQQGDFESE